MALALGIVVIVAASALFVHDVAADNTVRAVRAALAVIVAVYFTLPYTRGAEVAVDQHALHLRKSSGEHVTIPRAKVGGIRVVTVQRFRGFGNYRRVEITSQRGEVHEVEHRARQSVAYSPQVEGLAKALEEWVEAAR